jgi:hypothetical protein
MDEREKKRLNEKHEKILQEMLKDSANAKCADCNTKGMRDVRSLALVAIRSSHAVASPYLEDLDGRHTIWASCCVFDVEVFTASWAHIFPK